MALLASGVGRRDAGHGRDQRFVIGQECELPTFEKKTKMPDCEESREQFSVECGVFDLRRRQLF
jgi:hypothetical protein